MSNQQSTTEKDLRDYLADHLDELEGGLRLFQNIGRNGVEYQVEGGEIDILAMEEDQSLVVIELKVKGGVGQAIGQVVCHMAAIKKEFGPRKCRAIIVARRINPNRISAARELKDLGADLRLYEFRYTDADGYKFNRVDE